MIGWMRRILGKEARSLSPENPSFPLGAIGDLYDFGPRFAGVHVSPESMVRLPVVAACVRLVSDTIATVPLGLVDGDKTPAALNDAGRVVCDRSNPDLTSLEWRRRMMRDVMIHGDHFARIEWNNANRPMAIWPINPLQVTVARRAGRKEYTVRLLSGGAEVYPAEDVIHIMFDPDDNGLRSKKPWRVMGEAIALGLAMQAYGARFFESGGIPSMVVSQPGLTSQDIKQRAATKIADLLFGVGRKGGVLVIDGGQKVDVVSSDPRSGQFLEARQQQVEEICRHYGVPSVMVNYAAGSGAQKNVEQQGLLFEKHCIRLWAEIIEAELNAKLFQRQAVKPQFDLQGLQRGDFKSRIEAVARGVQAGVYSPNDGRRLLDLPPVSQDGADRLYLQQNMATLAGLPGGLSEPDADNPAADTLN